MPKALGFCTHMGDMEEADGSQHLNSLDLAFAANLGVSQRIEDLLYFSFSLHKNLPSK